MPRDIAREKWADREQVRRLNVALGLEAEPPRFERRARPRCTHTAENMMRMDENDFACPACSPEKFAAQLALAPDCDHEENT